MLKLLKIVKENTTSQQENSAHKKQKLWVYNRPIKKAKPKKQKERIDIEFKSDMKQ